MIAPKNDQWDIPLGSHPQRRSTHAGQNYSAEQCNPTCSSAVIPNERLGGNPLSKPTCRKNKMMKLKYLAILGITLGIGVVTSSARHRSFGDGKLPEILEQYDLNEDGKIDEEERQAAKEARRAARAERRAEHIAEFDTDGDGELSDEEKQAARDARREALQIKREEKFAEIAGEDGCLDLEEFSALPPFDGRNAERVAAIFSRLDSDEDDCVTLDEFTARLRHHRKPPRRPHHHHRDRDEDKGDEDEDKDDEHKDDGDKDKDDEDKDDEDKDDGDKDDE